MPRGFLWNERAGTRFFSNRMSGLPILGAPHNIPALYSQYLLFQSRRRDIYHRQGPKSPEQWNLAPQGQRAEDEDEAWDCHTGFAWRAGDSRLFHHEQMGDPPRDADLLRYESR